MMWAGNAIAGKIAVGHISPYLLTSLRWFLAMLIILPFALHHLKRDLPNLKPHLLKLFAMGAVGFTVFNNLMYLSLNFTSAVNVGILQASMPLFVFLLNFLIFGQRANWAQLAGFSITIIGVAIVTGKGSPLSLFADGLNWGDLLMLFAIAIYGAYTVALAKKPSMHWMSFISILGMSALIASLPFVFWEFHSGKLIWPNETGLTVALYTAIFPSICAQVLWMIAVGRIGSNKGGLFINLVPIFSAVFAILLLGEEFHFYHLVSLILVIGGVALAQRVAKATQT